MANNVGKTVEFAKEIIETLLNKSGAGIAATPLKVGLLSAIPGTYTEPLTGAEVAALEYDPGNFRSVALDVSAFETPAKDGGTASVKTQSTEIIEFPVVQAGVSFDILGYCLVKGDATTAASYLAYELFPAGSSKRKTVGPNDTIRINAGEFNLLER
jgi:hypothetical protein